MNKELIEALNTLEKEKNIRKDTLLEAIEQSLIQACKNHFGKADNVQVTIDRENGDFHVFADRTVVESVEDPAMEISLTNALKLNSAAEIGDVIKVEIKSMEFGRIATTNAKNVILQKIREEERRVLYTEYYEIEKEVVTGVVQRVQGKAININLGKVDAVLEEDEQVKGEEYKPTDRIKVYILEVKKTPKGPRIIVSRTHPDFVKRLFESEVAEVKEGTVEIKCIAREPGSRTKIAVWSNDPDVDPVGACVGHNGARVGAIVDELHGEKIDIINWDENPAILIENALSPAKVIAVMADPDENTAVVVVPDYQLSLAIGKEGQNARLAAKMTKYSIDIKSETQAREAGILYDYDEEEEEDYYDEYADGEYSELEAYDYDSTSFEAQPADSEATEEIEEITEVTE
ncbi:MAG: transcription termination factor NusA [Eubacteriales bacterium]|nr:transcription termination factor NusA [Eubacteriales bacterium]